MITMRDKPAGRPQNQKPRLFVDMDGTLAEWRNIKVTLQEHEDISIINKKVEAVLNKTGYFASLRPHKNVVEAIRKIIRDCPEIEVFVCTCFISEKAKMEKNQWNEIQIPELDVQTHVIFVPDGKSKALYIPGGITKRDCLLDDYTNNCCNWEKHGGRAVKLLNNINSSNGTWTQSRINYEKDPEYIAEVLKNYVLYNEAVYDQNPEKSSIEIDCDEFEIPEIEM